MEPAGVERCPKADGQARAQALYRWVWVLPAGRPNRAAGGAGATFLSGASRRFRTGIV